MPQQQIFSPKFKRAVRDHIELKLFHPYLKQLTETKERIISDHVKLTRSFEHAFRYRGTCYGEYKQKYKVSELHESLVPRFLEYKAENDQFYMYQHAPIMNYITQALNQCSTPNDLLAVMPEYTHSTFYSIIQSYLPKYTQSLTDKRIDEFNSKFQHVITLFKERLTLNLLLGE